MQNRFTGVVSIFLVDFKHGAQAFLIDSENFTYFFIVPTELLQWD
jgi:hypothetical protein